LYYSIIEDQEIAIYAEICITYLTKIYYNLAYDSAQIYIYDIIEFLKDEILSNPTGGKKVYGKQIVTALKMIWPIQDLHHQNML